MKHTAIILAAGQGKRMNSSVQKQYLLIKERPVLCYSLQTFEKASFIDEIILVVGKGEIPYCKKEIVDQYHINKVSAIVEGGRERYDSVNEGLKAVRESDYVYIHDGARPFLDEETLYRLKEAVEQTGACVAGMPSKDTVKLADNDTYAVETPDRSRVWIIQTPQVFQYALIKEAYQKFIQEGRSATDDAMVAEMMMGVKAKLVRASYRNIKITTPEDMQIAEVFCNSKLSEKM